MNWMREGRDDDDEEEDNDDDDKKIIVSQAIRISTNCSYFAFD